MKKTFCILLIGVLFSAGLQAETLFKNCDCDCNGLVTIGDVTCLVNYIFAGVDPPECYFDSVSVAFSWRVPGTVGEEAVTDSFRVIRTPLFGDTIPDLFVDLPVPDSLCAGERMFYSFTVPDNGAPYFFKIIYRIGESLDSVGTPIPAQWVAADSLTLMSDDYDIVMY